MDFSRPDNDRTQHFWALFQKFGENSSSSLPPIAFLETPYQNAFSKLENTKVLRAERLIMPVMFI